MEDEFTRKSDEELVCIIASHPSNVAYRSAMVEMHRRKMQKDDKNFTVQKWILRLTVVVLLLTAIGLAISIYK
jgi:hypothetical protein